MARKITVIGLICLVLMSALLLSSSGVPASGSALATTTPTGLGQYLGTWFNVDPDTSGIPKIIISTSKTKLFVHAFGKCHPTDCDMGQVEAYAYATNVSGDPQTETEAIASVLNAGFSVTIFTLEMPESGTLVVHTFTRFTDNSKRTAYTVTYTFKQANAPTGISGTSTQAATLQQPK